MSARPIAISKNLVTSRNIAGTRLRHVPSGAPSNTVALRPDNSNSSTTKPNTVASTRTESNCVGTRATSTRSTNSAANGTM